MLELKFLFAISILITILCAGWLPFKRAKRLNETAHEHDFSIGETLATGVFLGAGLLHMLPDASHQFDQQGFHYPLAELITGMIFLLFLWLEHLGSALYHQGHTHHHEPEHACEHPHRREPQPTQSAFAILAWLMLSFHSFILGTALGLNDQSSMITMLFLAIITHKWAESFAIAMQLSKTSLARWLQGTMFLFFALMTPLGILLGWYFEHHHNTHLIDSVLMAASAGTFLYLGTLHGLERCVLVERCCNLRDFSFVIIGFILMAAVAIYV